MKKRTITRKGGVLITTKKYVVKSIGFDKETHNPLITRFDIIDLINNPIFNMVSNEFEIEDKFESFWNRLNPIESSWYYKNIEIVKVLEVLPFKEFKMKYPNDYRKTKIIISKSTGFTNSTINNNNK
jgi:hypothetical protein